MVLTGRLGVWRGRIVEGKFQNGRLRWCAGRGDREEMERMVRGFAGEDDDGGGGG